jgi:hypothetical protein
MVGPAAAFGTGAALALAATACLFVFVRPARTSRLTPSA